jgi:hypothetical protein
MVAASTMPAVILSPLHRGPISMLFDRAAKSRMSWDAEPSPDRTMLVLQYFVAFIAVGAALLLSTLH